MNTEEINMEIFKNVATIVGCISACIALLVTVVKPLRQWLFNSIAYKAKSKELEDNIKQMNHKVDKLISDNIIIKERLEEVESHVLENEADRIRAEIFDCGNRCRRGIRLHPEEFDHLKAIFSKYTDVLHQNHEGEVEFNFISNYYNNQKFPAYHELNK